jgi:hypothetical protein
MVATLPYFYDGQMRRTIIQFMRIFSGFRVLSGKNSQGIQTYTTVPVIYGDGSSQALFMLQGNSENTVLSTPRISCYIINMQPAALKRGGYQGNMEHLLVTERAFDQDSGKYTDKPGNRYQVDRLQPNPVDITFKVDVWSSNQDQRLQLFEQIFTLFNPSLDIQTSSSPLDWTALQTVTLNDIIWDETGTTDEQIIQSFTFTVESYINPPARVKKQTLIHNIIQRMGDAIEDCDSAAAWNNGDTPLENVTTPGNHTVQVMGNQIILLGPYRNIQDESGNVYSWPKLIDQYGELVVNSSKIKLRWVSDIEDDSKDIIGYISLHPTIDNILLFNVISETLPLATQSPVQGIINPHEKIPGNGLPAAAVGQRYILSESIGIVTTAWGVLHGNANDIIEYNGSNWFVAMDADNTNTLEFVNDTEAGSLLKLLNHQWVEAVNLQYTPGYFRLVL